MQRVNVGICGLGTVGGGVLGVLARNAEEISRRTGCELQVSHVATRTPKPDLDVGDARVSDDVFAVANDPDVQIVLELIGGYDVALKLVMTAIEQGKHVVTANKALIAEHGNEIFAAARQHGVMVLFEAAVAGGIPIIKAIREGFAGNAIDSLAGIINGTGNFILTEMRDKGRDFEDVLQEAQALGYAEADPTFDVEGIDAAHKLAILASIAFGIPLQFDKVYTEGISAISTRDVEYAEELGYRIKHLGIARKTAAGVQLRVHPTLVPVSQLLANVNGVMNAVMVQGNAVGPTLHYGAGAGAEPTASAVVADVVDAVRMLMVEPDHRVPYLGFQLNQLSVAEILPIEKTETDFYLRLQVSDRPGVMADISRILSDMGISMEAIVQKEPVHEGDEVTIIILTHKVLESTMNQAIAQIESLDSTLGQVARIRADHFDS